MKKYIKCFIPMLLIIFMLSGCKWNASETQPYLSETYEVNDGDSSYTVTYEYVDSTNDRGKAPSFYKVMVLSGIVFFVMSFYFIYRVREINMLKYQCTVSVSALVTAV